MNKKHNSRNIVLVLVASLLIITISNFGRETIYDKYNEVDDLEIIKVLGMDKEEDDNVLVTVCSGVGLKGTAPRVLKKKAKTPSIAINFLQSNPSGNKPFMGYTDDIIIGEKAFRDGAQSYLDYAARSTDIRIRANVFVVKEGDAHNLIKRTSMNKSSPADMLKMISDNIADLGNGFFITCGDLCTNLEKSGNSLVTAIRAVPIDEESIGGGGSKDEKMIALAGFGVVKDGKLIDYVPEELSQSVCILMGKKISGHIDVDDGQGGKATLAYSKVSVKINPVFEGKELKKVEFNIVSSMNVEELGEYVDIDSDEEVRRQLAKKVAEYQKAGADQLIAFSKKLNVDFLNIGGRIRFKKPLKFDEMEKPWDETFKDVEIVVNSSAVLERTYDINKPLDLTGQEGEKHS